MKGADIRLVVDGADYGIERPSGLAIYDDVLYVGDWASNRVFGFTLQGDLIDYVELPISRGGMMGIEFDVYGAMYVADSEANEIVRFRPPNHGYDYSTPTENFVEYQSDSRLPSHNPHDGCSGMHSYGDTE